jgi:PTH1 family peptidyl-tRNA hydrolase
VTERLGELAKCTYKGRQIFCLKPSTFMNLSGKAVKYWQQKENIPNSQILIITDDLALPCGKMKLKPKGSDGGHNGLRSIDAHIGKEYIRVRIGVGKPHDKADVANYVLNNFSKEELNKLPDIIKHTINAIKALKSEDIEQVKTKFTLK